MNITHLSCVSCGHHKLYSQSGKYLICDKCKTSYPIIFNDVPVLLKDPNLFLASLYLKYSEYLLMITKKKRVIEKAQFNDTKRKEQLQSIFEAMHVNANYLNAIATEISQQLSIKDCVSNSYIQKRESYFNNFKYLKRDWSGEEKCEHEISVITALIKKHLASQLTAPVSSLFLGGGTGRLSVAFLDLFDHIYILESSLTMIKMFKDVIRREVEFYEVNLRNSFYTQDVIRKITASSEMIPPAKKEQLDKINYLLGSAYTIPLSASSVDVVFSIYFTDVVPLQKYFRKLNELIKKGGLFIHYGPLEYHYDDLEFMLSAEEIAYFFASNGYEVVVNEQVEEVAHLQVEDSLLKKTYRNWLLICRKV